MTTLITAAKETTRVYGQVKICQDFQTYVIVFMIALRQLLVLS